MPEGRAGSVKPPPVSWYPYSAATASLLAVLPVAGVAVLGLGLHQYLPAVATWLGWLVGRGIWVLGAVPCLCGLVAARIYLRRPAAERPALWRCSIWVWAWLWLVAVGSAGLVDKETALALVAGFPFFAAYHLLGCWPGWGYAWEN